LQELVRAKRRCRNHRFPPAQIGLVLRPEIPHPIEVFANDVRYSGIGVAVKLSGVGKLFKKVFEHFDRDAAGSAATDNDVLASSYDLG
jgi:hypothetical protein